MGKYTNDPRKHENLVFEEDALAMLNKCKSEKERLLLSLLWVTGARPAEIPLIKREDVLIREASIVMRITTLKLGRGKGFTSETRALEFTRPKGLDENKWIEIIVRNVERIPNDAFILKRTPRWMGKVINKLSFAALGKVLSPYNLRHSVFSIAMASNATNDQVMHMKGAKTLDSVSVYIHARPFVIDMQHQRRKRYEEEPPKESSDNSIAPPQ